jgi:Transposase domain (DUF772)
LSALLEVSSVARLWKRQAQEHALLEQSRANYFEIDTIDPAYYTVANGDGQTTPPPEADVDVGSDGRLPRSAAHPFYARLDQILEKTDFDGFVEALCQRFYADEIGRPGLASGRYFRLLLIGYFEGLGAERAISWRTTDSLALREFLGHLAHKAEHAVDLDTGAVVAVTGQGADEGDTATSVETLIEAQTLRSALPVLSSAQGTDAAN